MKKPEDIVKGATEHRKKLLSGIMPTQKEKKKLLEARGRVVKKESSDRPKYIPIGKVVRNKSKS